MKIGILTYHRAENYGALLQAYALRTYLQKKGEDVEFVDYWPKYFQEYHKLFSLNDFKTRTFIQKITLLIKLIIDFPNLKKKKRGFKRFMIEKLNLSPQPLHKIEFEKSLKSYDLILYGSDQIWRNQKGISDTTFDPWYFGENIPKSIPKIAFAASMGETSGISESDIIYLRKLFSNFTKISVREKELCDLLNKIGYDSCIVSDPVFLLTREEWSKLASPKKTNRKYVFVYNLLNNPETRKTAEDISKKYNYSIIEINKSFKIGKSYNKTATVEEFVSLIKNAEFVVSNSFHGIAFSIIFEKEFLGIGFGDRAERVKALLNILKLSERFLEKYDSKKVDLIKSINFSLYEQRILDYRMTSVRFIEALYE